MSTLPLNLHPANRAASLTVGGGSLLASALAPPPPRPADAVARVALCSAPLPGARFASHPLRRRPALGSGAQRVSFVRRRPMIDRELCAPAARGGSLDACPLPARSTAPGSLSRLRSRQASPIEGQSLSRARPTSTVGRIALASADGPMGGGSASAERAVKSRPAAGPPRKRSEGALS